MGKEEGSGYTGEKSQEGQNITVMFLLKLMFKCFKLRLTVRKKIHVCICKLFCKVCSAVDVIKMGYS